MTPDAGYRRLDFLAWAAIFAVAAFNLIAAFWLGFRIDWTSFGSAAITCGLLTLGLWFYRTLRPDPMLATAMNSSAQIIAFAAMGAPLSYMAASANMPLLDSAFDAADKAMGLHWQDFLAWMNANASLHPLFRFAYLSFTLQASAVVLALAFCARHQHLRHFMLAFILTAIVTILLSALMPAQGVYGFYNLSAADHSSIQPVTRELHLHVFNGLRDGSFRTLMGEGAEGIITFPSLHAALGLVFMLAMWPLQVLRWIGIAVNVLMIAASRSTAGITLLT